MEVKEDSGEGDNDLVDDEEHTESEPEEQDTDEEQEQDEEDDMDTTADRKEKPKPKKKRSAKPKSTTRRKGKKPPANEDPKHREAREAKPRNKRTAYQFFQMDRRKNHKEELGSEFGRASQILSKLWKATTPDLRKPFDAMAEADKKHHEQALEAWKKKYPEFVAKEAKEKADADAKKPKKEKKKRKAASKVGPGGPKRKKAKGHPPVMRVHMPTVAGYEGALEGMGPEDLVDTELPLNV